ncbi:MAG TPA: hypothetical protein VFA18_12570 [Gemmataceae bacterium]|nr:hypothetical protein [Gemmataceae bacterium]
MSPEGSQSTLCVAPTGPRSFNPEPTATVRLTVAVGSGLNERRRLLVGLAPAFAQRAKSGPYVGLGIVLLASVIAAGSARPYAGGWNDGSRLATVEALVDQGTWAIDASTFVHPPTNAAQTPYDPALPELPAGWTGDKLLIHHHFYSDKPPVPALLMAGIYRGWQALTGWTVRTHPAAFCYWMTLLSSGLAYVVAVSCIDRLGSRLGLGLTQRLMLTASFGLATVALPYVRHVNNHILLLGVAAPVMLGLHDLAERVLSGRSTRWRVASLGFLAGLGYTIDLGAGPMLMVCALALVGWRCRCWLAPAIFLLAAMPWLLLHHGINYATAGTLGPANAVAAYFNWPGSPFNPANMTGAFHHTPAHFVEYATALLLGKRGFLGHNLPLFLAVAGTVGLLRRRVTQAPEIVFGLCWCGAVWLAYGLTSTNYSGACCSIRWFVPFLAPGYYVLALLLSRQPRRSSDLTLLTLWGMLTAGLMWQAGPWMLHLVPFFWPIQAFALLSWLSLRRRQAVLPDWTRVPLEHNRKPSRRSPRPSLGLAQ